MNDDLLKMLRAEQETVNADLTALTARMEADGQLAKRLTRRNDLLGDMLIEYAEDIEHPAGPSAIIFAGTLTAEQLEALKKPSGLRIVDVEPDPRADGLVFGRPDNRQPMSEAAATKAPSPTKPRDQSGAPRPEGIPTNFEMVQASLMDAGEDGLQPHVIIDAVRSAFWPGLADKQLMPELYAYISDGRLVRRKEGWMALTEKGKTFKRNNAGKPAGGNPNLSATPKAEIRRDPQAVLNRAAGRAGPPTPRVLPEKPVTAPMPAVKPTLGPRPPAQAPSAIVTTDDGMREFAHGSKKTKFDVKEWRFVSQLYRVMGTGMLPSKVIVDHCLKGERSPPDARIWCDDMAMTVKKRLADIGLEVRPYEKMGFSMREIEA